MRFDVTSNGYTRQRLTLGEFASVISANELPKIETLKIGETYTRKPFAGQSGTYEFIAKRVS